MQKLIKISCFLTLVLFSFCKENKKDGNIQEDYQKLPSDFETFMTQFHTDSLFQMEHITFPLQGLPMAVDSVEMTNGEFRWQPEDWTLHRPFDNENKEYKQNFTQITEDLIIERVTTNQGDFGMERRFYKMDNGWNLIYYAAFNRISTTK